MTERVFNYENCTVIVHMGENTQKIVEKATEVFLKQLIKESEVKDEV